MRHAVLAFAFLVFVAFSAYPSLVVSVYIIEKLFPRKRR